MDNSNPVQQIEHVCKNCGANLEYDKTQKNTLKCNYCGTEITLVTPTVEKNFNNAQPNYSNYDKQRERRRLAQSQHRPDHDPGALSSEVGPYYHESNIESQVQHQPSIQTNNPQISTGKPKLLYYHSIVWGLLLWFIYYVVRAFLTHTKFDLADTTYHNILVSKMFDTYWLLRGLGFIVVTGIVYNSLYKSLRK